MQDNIDRMVDLIDKQFVMTRDAMSKHEKVSRDIINAPWEE